MLKIQRGKFSNDALSTGITIIMTGKENLAIIYDGARIISNGNQEFQQGNNKTRWGKCLNSNIAAYSFTWRGFVSAVSSLREGV